MDKDRMPPMMLRCSALAISLVSVSGKITLDGRLDLEETASEAADASIHILCLSMNHTLMDETAIISTHVCSHPLQQEK